MGNVDLILCEICLEEFSADQIRVCPSCATDVCRACVCEICHGEKEPDPVFRLMLELATDGDEERGERGERGEYLPSSDWIRQECQQIQGTWSPEEKERRRISEFTQLEAEEAGRWTVPEVRVPSEF